MNDITNGIQDAFANLTTLFDMLGAIVGGFVDVGAAMNAVLRVIAALTGA
ncbi:hypothetical protein [Noviherbaspirillum pedocola]|uniref:Uncharacterized protein n=1 Tax=Noviherbaspirillum pedocola TaxID=2801341 RepID=A0A934W9V8_9BURK|nr:hypothetical protein [Noviherbaspirillum pedocola]MBK4737679.1 hypothetical protein [Noviherbaspirillum pedocola]